jgi:hypothetical protein
MTRQIGPPVYLLRIIAGVAFISIGTLAIFEWTFGLAAFILAGILTYVGYRIFFRPALIELSILRKGEPASAVILEAWETGKSKGDFPKIGLKLEVRPPEMVPYQVEMFHKVNPSERRIFREGRVITVKIDSKNPKKIAILPKAS